MSFRKLLKKSFAGCPSSFIQTVAEPIVNENGITEFHTVERDICSKEYNPEIPVDTRSIQNMLANNQPLKMVDTIIISDSSVPTINIADNNVEHN